MAIVDVLYTRSFDKEDGASFVAPKSRGGGGLVVPRFIEKHFKELVGNNVSMGLAIDSFAYIKVYPTMVDVLEWIIFLNKFIRDVVEFVVGIFRAGEMVLEVKTFMSKLEN